MVLGVSYTLYGLAYSSYTYLIRYYASYHGVGYERQALYETIANFLSTMTLLYLLYLSERRGRLFTSYIFTLLPAFSPLLAISGDPVLLIPLALVIMNISFIAGIVARNLLLIDLGGALLGRIVGVLMTVFSLTTIVGPVIGYSIVVSWGYERLFIAETIMFILSSKMILVLERVAGHVVIEHGSNNTTLIDTISRIPRDLSEIVRDSRLRAFILFAVIDRFSYNMWAQVIYALTATASIGTETAALASSLQNMAWFATQYLFGFLSDKRDPVYILALSELLTGLAAVVMGQSISTGSSVGLLTAFVMIGLSIASWIPSYNRYFQVYVDPSARALFMTTTNIVASLVGSPAPLIGGVIRDATGSGIGHLYIASALHLSNAVLFLSRNKGSRDGARRPHDL